INRRTSKFSRHVDSLYNHVINILKGWSSCRDTFLTNKGKQMVAQLYWLQQFGPDTGEHSPMATTIPGRDTFCDGEPNSNAQDTAMGSSCCRRKSACRKREGSVPLPPDV
ncbi:unnamed protein product, partial [Ectocarpus sp. 4 AP-2014]